MCSSIFVFEDLCFRLEACFIQNAKSSTIYNKRNMPFYLLYSNVETAQTLAFFLCRFSLRKLVKRPWSMHLKETKWI